MCLAWREYAESDWQNWWWFRSVASRGAGKLLIITSIQNFQESLFDEYQNVQQIYILYSLGFDLAKYFLFITLNIFYMIDFASNILISFIALDKMVMLDYATEKFNFLSYDGSFP